MLGAGDDSCSGVGEVGEVPEVGHGKLSTMDPELGAVKTRLRVPGRGLRAVSCVCEQEAKKSPAAERVNIGVKGAGVDDGGRSSSRQQAAQRQANTPTFHSKWTSSKRLMRQNVSSVCFHWTHPAADVGVTAGRCWQAGVPESCTGGNQAPETARRKS